MISVTQFLIVAVQLGLLALIIRQFEVESSAFLRIALLTFGGFAVHCVLPLRYRLPFFVALSLAGIVLVLGLSSSAWLIGLGLVLIGLCHVPLPFAARVVLICVTGGLLAVLRIDWLHAPWSVAIWPILGSMFMFRLIVYLYDLQHDTAPASLARVLAYFFMLPNVCFPLFPVVDYKTFRRNYYNQDAYQIYQLGVSWMARGIIHLILYRIVYYYATLAPSEVMNPADLARYLLSNFLLYLRISGQFHLVVGMLLLFGFHLPETHHRYFLASSFTDFWRRINIYWKDFMLKVFYYPAYFALRRWGTNLALVLSTLVVFAATWLLHSYQWFWLRGAFPLTSQDVLFWGILAVLVVINSLYEATHAKARTLRKPAWTFRSTGGLALRTVGTFTVICILWSLWTSDSLSSWLALWTPLRRTASLDMRSSSPWLIGVVVLGIGSQRLTGAPSRSGRNRRLRVARLPVAMFSTATATTTAWLTFLGLLGIPAVYTQFGPTAATFIHSLRSGSLSRLDTALLEKGYYEDLLRVDRFNSQLWEVYMNRPLKWLDAVGVGLERFTGDFLQRELVPSFVSYTSGVALRTNRWGMRDQDYDKQPAPNAYRIALLGASSVMGWGVGDGQTFEALVEQRLNQEHAGQRYSKYELLNFGVSGYVPPQQLVVLQKALSFQPNAVFYVATGREAEQSTEYLVDVIRNRVDVPYEYLRETVRRAGVDAKTSQTEAIRRLEPFRNDMLAWLYRQIAQACRDRNILPVWIFLPQVRAGAWQEGVPGLVRLAGETGFTVVDLSGVYKGQDPLSLRLAEWDDHPNAEGHALVAARLYEALNTNDTTALQLLPTTVAVPTR